MVVVVVMVVVAVAVAVSSLPEHVGHAVNNLATTLSTMLHKAQIQYIRKKDSSSPQEN